MTQVGGKTALKTEESSMKSLGNREKHRPWVRQQRTNLENSGPFPGSPLTGGPAWSLKGLRRIRSWRQVHSPFRAASRSDQSILLAAFLFLPPNPPTSRLALLYFPSVSKMEKKIYSWFHSFSAYTTVSFE